MASGKVDNRERHSTACPILASSANRLSILFLTISTPPTIIDPRCCIPSVLTRLQGACTGSDSASRLHIIAGGEGATSGNLTAERKSR